MGTSLAGVDAAVKAKARRMSPWVGGLAGIFGSFVGVGGGVLISPIIANACRSLPQRVISGTSLAAVVAVGSASGYVYWSTGYVDMTSVLLVACTAVLTAPLGARATHMVDCGRLRSFMGYWLYFVAPLVPLKSYIFSTQASTADAAQQPAPGATPGTAPGVFTQSDPASSTPGAAATVTSMDSSAAASSAGTLPAMRQGMVPQLRELRSTDAAVAAVGGVAGFASGLLGVGGGTIVTPLLALLTGMPQTSVVGTSLAAMVVPACVGLAQHARLGNVDWRMAAGLISGSFAGSYLGSHIAVHTPPMVMEAAFAVGMAYLGHKTLRIARASGAAATTTAAVKST